VAGVGAVDDDSGVVAPSDDFAAKRLQALVHVDLGAESDEVFGVVGELDDPDTQALERVDVAQIIFQRGGALEVEYHPGAPFGLRGACFGAGGAQNEVIALSDEAKPLSDQLQREGRGEIGADCGGDDVDAALDVPIDESLVPQQWTCAVHDEGLLVNLERIRLSHGSNLHSIQKVCQSVRLAS